MFRLSPHRLPAVARWFDSGAPESSALAEHVAATGVGAWWGDRALSPRAVAVSCAGNVLFRGDPGALTPELVAPFAHSRVEAPPDFLPLFRTAFDRVVPAERLVYAHREPVAAPRPPRGVTVRRLRAADAGALARLHPAAAWIHASWGGPEGLAASGHGWAAFDRGGRVLTVACGYFAGTTHEQLAVLTPTEHRHERLALACVAALCAEVTARGRTASWSCGRGNRLSRLLAWTAGFRLEREYVRHVTGAATARPQSPPRVSA
ncbi:GNAT family N-acetyltransferase [Streptomyces flavofungini]|uniref:GNAT family N-acetyltransferase n=1 Tax=Streptomyces flavofungini TaxID=68200 RepID=UPI0034DF3B56